MDITFTTSDLLRAGIIVNVCIWAYLRFKSRKSAATNVYKAEKYYDRSKLSQSVGWVIVPVILVAGIIIFPFMYIITQDADAAADSLLHEGTAARHTFKVKTAYVPFYYKGHSFAPFGRYISNETDSTLVLYNTVLFNGYYEYVTSEDDFVDVLPHSFMKWDKTIENKFKKPRSTWYGDVSDSNRNKKIHSWTLDTREDATRDSRNIAYEILKQTAPILHSDSIYVGSGKYIPRKRLFGDFQPPIFSDTAIVNFKE